MKLLVLRCAASRREKITYIAAGVSKVVDLDLSLLSARIQVSSISARGQNLGDRGGEEAEGDETGRHIELKVGYGTSAWGAYKGSKEGKNRSELQKSRLLKKKRMTSPLGEETKRTGKKVEGEEKTDDEDEKRDEPREELCLHQDGMMSIYL